MRNMVISASAGSGKTYRLAVEYISLIVKNLGFADFHFERILVITFTKKATAEIRSQIFAMFDLIFCEDPNLQPQRTALLKILEEKTGIAFTDDLFATLQRQIISIKTQKDKVRISTIDSLINQVFKAMIAPIMKIAFYTIEENANYDIWMEIFPELVKDKNIAILKKIFEYDTEKILSNLTDAFEVLVENRWVLHWMKAGNHTLKSDDGKEFLSPEMIEKAKTEAHTEYCKQFRAYTGLLKATILEKMAVSENDPLFSDYFTKGPMAILAKSGTLTAENFDILIEEFLQKGIFSLPKSALKLLVDNEAKIHNGTRIRKIDTSRLKSALVLFAYYHYYAEEQLQLIKLWEVLLQKYDDLKQSSGKLSYSDITWFTYSHLYAPEHSMIDPQSFAVENQFYEFLAVRNQYLLIDEFQDTSFMQFMILAPMMTDLIAGNSVHSDTAVIVVGDEKQSIYGWRGGEKALLNYMQTFLGTAIESMTHCYRSAPLLVNYVNLLFGTEERPQNGIPNNAWQFTGDIISAKTDEKGAVNCKFIDDDDKENVLPADAEQTSNTDNSEENRYISDFILNFVLPQLKEQNLGEVAIITRKNKDLDTMAAILSEQNVRFVKESSLPVFDHPIAQSIYLLLDFIQHKNYSSLLDFMRSEVAGLPPTDLKKAAIYFSTKIVGNASCETPENDTTRKAALGSEGSDIYTKVLSLAELYKADSHQNTFQNLLSLCYEIVKVFDFASVYAKESELKNLHYFLSIVADFMRNPKEFTPDVEGFLLYYQKMKQKKERKQQSTQAKGVINLLTIHKSKGLGFDTVFVYYDTIKKQDLRSRLNMDYLVDHSSFRSLKNVLFSLRYKFILEQVFADDYAQINQRNQTEEMNNIYVAFTRAKTNLGVYWLYKSSEIAQNKVPYAAKLVSAALQAREQYQSAMVDIPENKILAAEQQTDLSFLLEYFDPPKKLLVLQKKETEYDDISLKNKYLKNKNKLLGNATHLYLSFIKYDAEAEHELARLQVIKHYGNILSRSEIENIYSITRNFIEEKHHYFSHNWDLIFTEFPVFDSWSNLFRIDRMMINIPQKKILIVDYKTGKINDQQQLNNYKKIISQYCQNQNKDYQIEVEFAMVN